MSIAANMSFPQNGKVESLIPSPAMKVTPSDVIGSIRENMKIELNIGNEVPPTAGDFDSIPSHHEDVLDSNKSPDEKPQSKLLENGHTLCNEVVYKDSIEENVVQTQDSTYLDIIHDAVTDNKKYKMKKHVNICTSHEDIEEEGINNIETTALRRGSETSDSVADHSAISSTDGCLTMTGTIKRGKKAGQSVDVRLNISREELEGIEATINAKRSSVSKSSCTCSSRVGPHITLWTIICLPFACIASGIYSFYIGTMTWYNIFTYYTEEKPVVCRVLVSPFLILFYPFLIIIFTLGLGLYAGFIQISWYFDSWYKDITDWEKGFYGWLCAVLKHEECSPYEVVILTDIHPELEGDGKCSLDDNSTFK